MKDTIKYYLLSVSVLCFILPTTHLYADTSAFDLNIETRYQKILNLFNEKKYSAVVDKTKEFRKHLKMDYKDIRAILKMSRTELLKNKAAQTPESDLITKLSLYQQLKTLNPDNPTFQYEHNRYYKKYINSETNHCNARDELRRLAFEKNFEAYYLEILTLYNEKKYRAVVDKGDGFREYLKMNYKDVRSILKDSQTQLLMEKAAQTPDSDLNTKLSLYQQLKTLNPEVKSFQHSYDRYFKVLKQPKQKN